MVCLPNQLFNLAERLAEAVQHQFDLPALPDLLARIEAMFECVVVVLRGARSCSTTMHPTSLLP